MPTLRYGHAAAVANGKIYVIGGDNGSFLGTVEVNDPDTDTWSNGASLPTPRRYLSASTIAGRIYAIGGEDGTGFLDVVEVYDPGTDTWFASDSMLTARAEHGAAVVSDTKLYAIGGTNGSDLNVNKEFNPRPWQPLNLTSSVEPTEITLDWSANIEPDLAS